MAFEYRLVDDWQDVNLKKNSDMLNGNQFDDKLQNCAGEMFDFKLRVLRLVNEHILESIEH